MSFWATANRFIIPFFAAFKSDWIKHSNAGGRAEQMKPQPKSYYKLRYTFFGYARSISAICSNCIVIDDYKLPGHS